MNITLITLAAVAAVAAIGVTIAASDYGGSVGVTVGTDGIDFEMTGKPTEIQEE